MEARRRKEILHFRISTTNRRSGKHAQSLLKSSARAALFDVISISRPGSIALKPYRRIVPPFCVKMEIYSMINTKATELDVSADNWPVRWLWHRVFPTNTKDGVRMAAKPGPQFYRWDKSCCDRIASAVGCTRVKQQLFVSPAPMLQSSYLASSIPLHRHYTTATTVSTLPASRHAIRAASVPVKVISIQQSSLTVHVHHPVYNMYTTVSVYNVSWRLFFFDPKWPRWQGRVRVLHPRGRGTGALEVDVCLSLSIVGGACVQLWVALDDGCPRTIDDLWGLKRVVSESDGRSGGQETMVLTCHICDIVYTGRRFWASALRLFSR